MEFAPGGASFYYLTILAYSLFFTIGIRIFYAKIDPEIYQTAVGLRTAVYFNLRTSCLTRSSVVLGFNGSP